jgi:tRNA(Arg) A34 adenosine deaminase TadA
MSMSKLPPVLDPDDPLAVYWKKPVSDLATVAAAKLPAEQCERHRIYSLVTMGLVASFWNGNKRGQNGNYPWRKKQKRQNGTYAGDRLGDRYLGHNIASIAVDGNGDIIDFEFNHNDIFNSSAEHAEARLVRRVFSLAQIYDDWQTRKPGESRSTGYSNLLSSVTIYTSLESCAQCSGIMTLGNVDKVVYLQQDPGQRLIGNMLYNLTNKPPKPGDPPATVKYGAPNPIGGADFGFDYTVNLDQQYFEFHKKVRTVPFYIARDGKKDTSQSITSFLCTDVAKDIFDAAAGELKTLYPLYPDYKPQGTGDPARVRTNAQALSHAQGFLLYASETAQRGTPHK